MADNPGAADYRWQNQSGQGPAAGGSRRGVWLFVLTGLVLALATVVLVWILLFKPPPPPPFYLLISIADHDARAYPIIPFTRQDAVRILRHFPARNQAETKTKKLLRDELDALKERTDPLIVHITALAVARADQVFLLPGEADPGDESTWINVREVLTALGECQKTKHKLLILDLAHPLADARLGVLSDRVAETLADHLAKEPPSFFVLCACSAGQVSLRSEALQASVLAYYLDQGLQGHASVNQNPRLMVKDLCNFAAARVDRWAHNNRGLAQRPRLFGDAEDFVVANISKDTPGELERAEPEAYPDRLQKGWQDRDGWHAKEAFRRAPRTFAKLEANLLRQESLWRGGAIQKKDLDSLDEDLNVLGRELGDALAFRATPPRSLALALAQSKKDAPLADALLNILANAKEVGAKKDVNDKVEERIFKTLQDPKGPEFPMKAWATLDALLRLPQLKPEHVRIADGTLTDLKPKQTYVETLYLRRIAALAERRAQKDWHDEKVKVLLETMRARAIVSAALDREPSLLPWLAAPIEAGDALRQVGERKLLWEGRSTWDDGFKKLQTALVKYQEAQRYHDILQRGRLNIDRAFRELPAYARLICDGQDIDPQSESAWHKAVEEAGKLQAFFANFGPTRDDPITMDAPSSDLGRHLGTLQKRLFDRIERAVSADTPEALDQLHFLLQSPLLTAERRGTVEAKHKALALKLNEENAKLDQEDNKSGRVTAPAHGPRRASESGPARARMSVALLRLGGAVKEERDLRAAWSKDLLKRWSDAKPGPAADALNRLLSPWEQERRTGALERDPSVVLQRTLRHSFRQWLIQRYDAEAGSLMAIKQESEASGFYQQAAQELH